MHSILAAKGLDVFKLAMWKAISTQTTSRMMRFDEYYQRLSEKRNIFLARKHAREELDPSAIRSAIAADLASYCNDVKDHSDDDLRADYNSGRSRFLDSEFSQQATELSRPELLDAVFYMASIVASNTRSELLDD